MKRFLNRWLLPVASLLVAAPAAAQEFQPGKLVTPGDPADAYRVLYNGAVYDNAQMLRQHLNATSGDDLGASLAPVDAALRSQLGLPGDFGLVVVEVQDGGRAARAGLKANDILLSLDRQPLARPEDFLGVLKKSSQQHPADSYELELIRNGKPVTLWAKAEVRVALGWEAEKTTEFFIGTPATPLDATFRAHLDIPEGTGLIVSDIQDGTPAGKAGVMSGDILLAFAGHPLPDVDSLRALIQAKGANPAKLRLLRGGKPIELTITPEPRSAEADTSSGDMARYYAKLFNSDQSQSVNIPYIRRWEVAESAHAILEKQPGGVVEVLSGPPEPTADLAKKIDDLTAQVQALAKAVESLCAAQAPAEKK